MNEEEPFAGENCEMYSPQWLERYEYIEARGERYFDNFRANPLYDFTRTNETVEYAQKQLIEAYETFACGKLTLYQVTEKAKALRHEFARSLPPPKKQDPPPVEKRNYARENWERKQKTAQLKREGARVWHHDETMKTRELWARRDAYRAEFSKHINDKPKPLRGKVTLSLCGGLAWNAQGEPISEPEAVRMIDASVCARLEDKPPAKPISDDDLYIHPVLRPAPASALNAPEMSEKERLRSELQFANIETGGKDLDSLKREAEQMKIDRRLKKVR